MDIIELYRTQNFANAESLRLTERVTSLKTGHYKMARGPAAIEPKANGGRRLHDWHIYCAPIKDLRKSGQPGVAVPLGKG